MMRHGSPTTARASTCRSSTSRPEPTPVHVRPSAATRPPARCRTELPPRVCAGPRLRHPGSVGWLKQHRHQHHQRHQHGGAACLGRRRPAARGGSDPLGGASQGDYPRRGGGGLPHPFYKRSSTANAQPLSHRRRRTQAIPKPPVTPTVAAYATALAALPAGASYDSHWPWLCGGPIGWVVRAEHWVWWGGLLG